MEVILNIGCDSKVLGKIPPMWVVSAARLQFINVIAHKVVQSDTEKTVVLHAHIDGPQIERVVTHLCEVLKQDCIGVWAPAVARGDLVGPKAKEWGAFNPEFFFMLDGSRLSAPGAAKAA